MKNNRGGKREGAGRPKVAPEAKKQTLTIRIDQDVLAQLNVESLARYISKSELARIIISGYFE